MIKYYRQTFEEWALYLSNTLQDRFARNIQQAYTQALNIMKGKLPSYLEKLRETESKIHMDNLIEAYLQELEERVLRQMRGETAPQETQSLQAYEFQETNTLRRAAIREALDHASQQNGPQNQAVIFIDALTSAILRENLFSGDQQAAQSYVQERVNEYIQNILHQDPSTLKSNAEVQKAFDRNLKK